MFMIFLRLLLKVTDVTTKQQKLPKISKNSIKSLGQSPPQELEESLLYLLVTTYRENQSRGLILLSFPSPCGVPPVPTCFSIQEGYSERYTQTNILTYRGQSCLYFRIYSLSPLITEHFLLCHILLIKGGGPQM